MERNFGEMLKAQWDRGNFVCVGLDSEYEKIPQAARKEHVDETIFEFNRAIVDATKDLVCAYKPNPSFYKKMGTAAWHALRLTFAFIRQVAPDVPVIFDAKYGDIDNTNLGYAYEAFDEFHADAVTVQPYLGGESLRPFLKHEDKGIIVLCRTSNKGAGEFQDLHTFKLDPRAKPEEMSAEEWLKILCKDVMRLYERVAFNVAHEWNKNTNCHVVVGATYPTEAKSVRRLVGDLPFLIPGVGAQGGDVEATVLASTTDDKRGMIINSSRGIIFASSGPDFAEAARRETIKLRDTINQYR